MPTTLQLQQQERVEQHRREALDALIAEQVLHALGEPGELLRVHVRPLWEAYYRVNVLVGVDAASARVAHSYFLAVDGDGGVLASTPNITRQY